MKNVYFFAGKHPGPDQLPGLLGRPAVLQFVLWARGLWSWDGHHADRSPRFLYRGSVEKQTQVGLYARRWVSLPLYNTYSIIFFKCFSVSRWSPWLTPLVCIAEKVTYQGQKLFYVVFPQEDSSETEPLTAKEQWSRSRLLCAPTSALPAFVLIFFLHFFLSDFWSNVFKQILAQVPLNPDRSGVEKK